MKQLTPEIKKEIVERVKYEPHSQRRLDHDTGEILEPFRAYVKFGFECNAKSAEEAREIILREATKFFNGILSET